MAALGWLLNLGFGGGAAAGPSTINVPFLAINRHKDMAIRNQTLTVNFLAWDTSANTGKTGDSANFTMRLVKDGGTPAVLTNALSEPDATNMPGTYEVVLTATEMDADFICLHGISSTGNIVIFPLHITTESGDLANLSSSLSNIANVGAAVHKPASSYTLTTGTQSANLYTDTEELNGTRHTHTDTAGVMELYYEFSIGSGVPTSVYFSGALTGGNDDLDIYGYDWVSTSWKMIGSISGSASTANEIHAYDMFVNMVGSGADEGTVQVRFYKASGLTSATLYIDQIYVAFNQGVEGYENGAIWIDTGASNTNVVVGIDGVARNPVSTIAAANTLSASTNLNRFEIAPNSTITLAATQNNQLFFGHGWILALGGQDVDGCHFADCAVSGIGTAAGEMEFHNCEISTASVQKAHHYGCTFDGTVTMTLAGDYHYIDCQSGVAGAGSPTFTKTAGQAITAEFRRWSGGITISGLESGDTLTVSGELGTVTLNGADATVEIRGTYKALTNNLTGSPTVNTDGAIKGVDVASILTDTGTTLENHLTDIKGTGFVKDTHSLVDIEAYVDILDDGTSGNVKIASDIFTIEGVVNNILTDTETTLETHLTDIKGTGFVKDTHSLVDIEAYVDILDDGTSGNVKIAADVANVLVDTGTTLEAHLTDIKGTGFVKDTHSLIDIETYVDILDDATSGNAKIATDVAATLVDTNELQGDLTDGGRLDLLIDSLVSLLDDARGEPAQGAPPVNPDAMTKIDYLYKAWRNKIEQTETTMSIYDDAGTTVDHKATVNDNGTTATKGEIVTGP